MDYRASTSHRTWLLVPGTVVALFAIASIVLPIGSAQVGRVPAGEAGGAVLARFAQDIHDGFWQRRGANMGCFEVSCQTIADDESEGLRYCRMGQAREAIAAFQTGGELDENERQALYDLLDRLVMDGKFDLAEWYVREADMLLHGGGLRNNLAWHYTQVDMRSETALALALSSVTAEREPFNVDTLAWAYYRNGDLQHAVEAANEAITMSVPNRFGWAAYDDAESRESSRRLLKKIAVTAAAAELGLVPAEPNPFAAR